MCQVSVGIQVSGILPSKGENLVGVFAERVWSSTSRFGLWATKMGILECANLWRVSTQYGQSEGSDLLNNERQISSAVSTVLRVKRFPFAWTWRRSSVDTAICAKPLTLWMYGDWMDFADSRCGGSRRGRSDADQILDAVREPHRL